jgi:drug/metabolite transporter (DMT)-like permease
MPAAWIGLGLGVASALVWGSGDFAGGIATRRARPFQIVALVSLVGFAVLFSLSWLTGSAVPAPADWGWAIAAGTSGAIGVTALYRGLAMRAAAIVAPTSAVVGAAVPVLAGLVLEGLPRASQAMGFAAGCAGIWLVSGSPGVPAGERRRSLWLAVGSGVFVGGFLVLIAQVKSTNVFAPLTIAKAAGTTVALIVLLFMRTPLPSVKANSLALLAGVLDAGGNVLFVLSSRFIRLDVAAVLSAMAPAVTVVLSAWVVHEGVTRWQWLGVMLCLGAVGLLAV